jgi:hypothetical protein
VAEIAATPEPDDQPTLEQRVKTLAIAQERQLVEGEIKSLRTQIANGAQDLADKRARLEAELTKLAALKDAAFLMKLPTSVTIFTRDLIAALIGAAVVAAAWYWLG